VAASAFIIQVPEAEPCVGDLRLRYDASARLGVPAHFTVLVPFMDPAHIDGRVLDTASAAIASVKSFKFRLHRVGRFPLTAYLEPDAPEPLISLTRALSRVFPEYLPYGGAHDSIVPHLTVADGSAEHAGVAALEMQAWLRQNGPIDSTCTSVDLLENSTGYWRPMHAFKLPGAEG
jgi:2'-5' RNA ligase